MLAVAAISAAAPTKKSVDKKVTDADRDKRGVFGEHHGHSFQQSQSLELTQGYSYEEPQQQEQHQPEQQGYTYEQPEHHHEDHHEHVRTQYVHVPQPYPVEKVVEKIVHVDRPVEKIVHVPQVFLKL